MKYLMYLSTFMIMLLTHSAFTEDAFLDYEAWDGEKADETKVEIYRPYPIIFVHGFAGGGPDTWEEVLAVLADYYDGTYKPILNSEDDNSERYDLNYFGWKRLADPFPLDPGTESQRELQYLERIDMQDPNGSIDIYNPDDEIIQTNPQNYNHGWAHKLAEAIQFTLSDYGTDKVILVCHSMGGLALGRMN